MGVLSNTKRICASHICESVMIVISSGVIPSFGSTKEEKNPGGKSTFNVGNGGCGPKEFKYHALPYCLFYRTIKQEMVGRVICDEANGTQGRIEEVRHPTM